MPLRLVLILALVVQSLTVQSSCDQATAAQSAYEVTATGGEHSCCCGDGCPMIMAGDRNAASAACGCDGGESRSSSSAPATLPRGEQDHAVALLAAPLALLTLPACESAPTLAAARMPSAPACALHVIHCIWMI